MGWAGGSELADKLWKTIKKYVPKANQRALAIEWVDIFEGEDCDTMCESVPGELAGLRIDSDEEEE